MYTKRVAYECYLVTNCEHQRLTTRKAAWYSISGVSVCQTISFEGLSVYRKFLFTHPIYFQRICEVHRVKVKVTGAKIENLNLRKVKLRVYGITQVLQNINP